MKKTFEAYLPIQTVSEANGGKKKAIIKNGRKTYTSEHWSEKSKRHKAQKKMIWWLLNDKKPPYQLPLTITLTRISPRYMDFGNLVSSFKWIEDACAEYVHPGLAPGRADGLGDINFLYKQEKGLPNDYQIKIEFYCE